MNLNNPRDMLDRIVNKGELHHLKNVREAQLSLPAYEDRELVMAFLSSIRMPPGESPLNLGLALALCERFMFKAAVFDKEELLVKEVTTYPQKVPEPHRFNDGHYLNPHWITWYKETYNESYQSAVVEGLRQYASECMSPIANATALLGFNEVTGEITSSEVKNKPWVCSTEPYNRRMLPKISVDWLVEFTAAHHISFQTAFIIGTRAIILTILSDEEKAAGEAQTVIIPEEVLKNLCAGDRREIPLSFTVPAQWSEEATLPPEYYQPTPLVGAGE